MSIDIAHPQNRHSMLASSPIGRVRTSARKLKQDAEEGQSAVAPFYLILQALAIVVPIFLIVLGVSELAYYLG
jgi:hypothetical protein